MLSVFNQEIKLGDWIVWSPRHKGTLRCGKVVHVGSTSLKVRTWCRSTDEVLVTVRTRNIIKAIPMSALKRYEEHVPS